MAFKKGQSGNPAGKPKGATDWRSKLREQLEKSGPKVINTVIQAAQAGDLQASKIIIDRLIPPLKSAALPVNINLPTGPGFLERAEAVFSAAARGEVALEDATGFLSALAAVLKAKEIDDLEHRIAKLEKGVINEPIGE